MSVAPGALGDERRAAIREFYGSIFGWHEMGDLSNEARMTIAIGPGCYINVREHEDHRDLSYEHFGVLVDSADEVRRLWEEVHRAGVSLEPLESPAKGQPSFRFRHLLPMAIEVQYFSDVEMQYFGV